MEQVGEVFMRVIEQQVILLYTVSMIRPRVLHLCQSPVIQANPPVKNTSHDFQEENNHQLGAAQTGFGEKGDFGNQPGYQHEVRNKNNVFQ